MNVSRIFALAVAWGGAGLTGLAQPGDAVAGTTLRSVFKESFRIGVAVNAAQFNGTDTAGRAAILREFDSITPENALKWDAVQPRRGEFRFASADDYVEFGVSHGLWTIGHTLVWHSQLPPWVAESEPGRGELTKEDLLARLKTHITTVVGRYRGKVRGWDVVNEAVEDGGGYRASVFYQMLGPEYIVQAFHWAHAADPAAELYYNDYNLDADDRKRATALELVRSLKERGAPIHGVGLQGHYNLTQPGIAKIEETIRLFAGLGVKVMITELDVEVNREPEAAVTGAVGVRKTDKAGPTGLSPAEGEAQARRYGEIFAMLLRNRPAITRVTLWGLRDADSWRREASPLIFDDAYVPKPAYQAILRAKAESRRTK
jgi:endo-1,4-beta-xylanase